MVSYIILRKETRKLIVCEERNRGSNQRFEIIGGRGIAISMNYIYIHLKVITILREEGKEGVCGKMPLTNPGSTYIN